METMYNSLCLVCVYVEVWTAEAGMLLLYDS